MQLKTSKIIQSFHERFRKKFSFEEYRSKEKPAVFFGLYTNSDRHSFSNHVGPKILWLAGSDAIRMLRHYKFNKIDKNNFKKCTIIAESEWIKKDLDVMGLNYHEISFCLDDLYKWKPEPLGDSLYWYGGGQTKYGKEYMGIVRETFPDLPILVLDHKSIAYEQMPEFYKKCFAGIRLVEHDGFSQTVAEMGLMGRPTIWNGKCPASINYKNIDDVLKIIEGLRRADWNYKLLAKRTRNFFIENEKKWTNLILDLFNTDELDAANIFHEDPTRCGSIFRIQRTSDIYKIGGLGDKQFERRWYMMRMKELGKKSLITSKHSGFIVSEFKNIDKNKGYLPGIEYNTHDRTTD